MTTDRFAEIERRIAVIESTTLDRRRSEDNKARDDKDFREKVLEKLQTIELYQSRQKGVFGAAMWGITAFFGVGAFLLNYLTGIFHPAH